MNVLLVEDDLQLGSALLSALETGGFTATWLRRVIDARTSLSKGVFDVALVDVQLPDGLGYDLLPESSSVHGMPPIIFITVRDSANERIEALNRGADDYVVKPFVVEELLSRVRAVVRRRDRKLPQQILARQLEIDLSTHEVRLRGVGVRMTDKEFLLLAELAKLSGRTLPRAQLEACLSSSGTSIESNVLDVHMYNLRRKLGAGVIHTVRGAGYRIEL
jgi:DNA-binding response OmpR family regulator